MQRELHCTPNRYLMAREIQRQGTKHDDQLEAFYLEDFFWQRSLILSLTFLNAELALEFTPLPFLFSAEDDAGRGSGLLSHWSAHELPVLKGSISLCIFLSLSLPFQISLPSPLCKFYKPIQEITAFGECFVGPLVFQSI